MTATERKPKPQTAQLLLPVEVWREIVEACAKGQSGQITLHLKEGKIMNMVDIYMRVRAAKDDC